jgi:hypothetical protein
MGRLSRVPIAQFGEQVMAKKPRSGATRGKHARLAPTTMFRVFVETSPHETVRNLGAFDLSHCCMPQPPRDEDGGQRLHAFATGATVMALRKAGRTVHVLADATAEGKRAQKHIGKGDRFQGGQRSPVGIGKLI